MKTPSRLVAGLLFLCAFAFAGCGPEPMEPAEQAKAVSEITELLQDLAVRTNSTLDFPEYYILLQDIDMAYEKISPRLDRAVGEKVEFAIAPFHSAYNDWMSFNQGKLQAPDNNIVPVLVGHWKIGRERVRDLAKEYRPSRR